MAKLTCQRRETGGLSLKTNLFEVALKRGNTIRDVTFEPGGLDEDDDYLVLTLDDDAGARKIRSPTGDGDANGAD